MSYAEACEILDEMVDTSSARQGRANVPQGDPNMIHLHIELHDHGREIAELTTTMTQLAKAQIQQVQGLKQVNAMDKQRNANNDEVRIDIDDKVEETHKEVNLSRKHIVDILEPVVPKAKVPMPRPPPPHPQRIAKQNGENQFKKFIDMMKSLSINVPLVEVLDQMPDFAKFMNDLVKKKRSMNCINLMPYSVFKTLGIGKPRPISMRLHMADRTMKKPLCIINGVFVRVDEFILPTDFVIIDCEVDYDVSIILGTPILSTGKAELMLNPKNLLFGFVMRRWFSICASL
uniref:Uncharacterized protein LOC104234441 n=1 Tax=Nicotiana sylvestris TaxID=4096 RepID=A0A1U7XIK8_NICSY|nr:PREDICTED: uncharacterized protein LOC104234441 [Nicotiana sylvestris]